MFRKIIIFLFLILLSCPNMASAVLIPNDPLFYNQNYLKSIRAQDAWDISDGRGVTIAFLDSGVDINHPDLRENIWINLGEIPDDGIDNDHNGYIDDLNGWDFIDNDNSALPDLEDNCLENGNCSNIGVNHGTIVAGVAAAKGENREGIIGLAYRAKIMPLRILDNEGVGNIRAVVEGINYAISKKADIINLSLVGSVKSDILDKAIRRAHKKGIVIVAASGNDSLNNNGFDLDQTPMYPVCEDQEQNFVLGVGALDKSGKKLNVSNYGSKSIDVSVIGENFYSTLFYSEIDDSFSKRYGGWWSGTSVSTALVSGTAALIRSVNPHFDNDQIMDLIINTSNSLDNLEPKFSGKMGKGSLDVYRSVKAAVDNIDDRFIRRNYSQKYLLGAPDNNFNPTINFFNLSENNFFVKEFFAYDKNFRGGVNVASGDIDGDGISEIITGAGKGGGPHIMVFDQINRIKSQFFAYDKNFRGGVNVASGDIDGDGISEIITGAGKGGGPHIRVFDIDGNLMFQFF
ncbi:MAG: S8 family serine peptidase, partial [Patescibacteria group bacterium]|nr:S8 family serine peptidase [Patescibacteria group bacterium]